MNTQSSFSLNTSRRGVALVIVLSMLVLMSAILVAFMGSVSSERAAQRAAYSGFEAQQAAESAVNLVISQIRSATSNVDGTAGWASQPGAIRTFGAGGEMVYKLYSSDNMQQAGTAYKPETFEESGYDPNQPKATKPEFVDLNQPVLTPAAEPGKVEPHYPIVDPRAALLRTGGPAAAGKGRVEGFWVSQSNFHFSGKRDPNNAPIMEVPMRVRWLYQLKDGKMVAADRGTGEIPGAEKDNPPVARVAFWTDDESSKLNINTAGENTYWDSPMASVLDEAGDATSTKLTFTNPQKPPAGLGASQPTQGEYQRYPGHPATTNLSPALRWLFKPAAKTVANDWEFKEALYRLLPRYQGGEGSSMGGTRANDDKDLRTVDRRLPKRDRLFSSLDEFWFRPDRSPISDSGFFGVFRKEGGGLAPDWDKVDPDLPNASPQVIEQLRFFLTAHSRSPDLNAFGMPRVSIWPVHEVDNKNPLLSKRSGFDDLMAFCASVSKKSYYFTRADPWSTTTDLESGTQAVDPLPSQPFRNRNLLFAMTPGGKQGYLQRLGKRPIPGAGGSLADKYSAPDPTGNFTEYERILLSIFDYIRTTNLIDTGRKDINGPIDSYKLAYTPGYSDETDEKKRYERNTKAWVGSGQVVPSVVYQTGATPPKALLKGFGRFVNLSEVALLFYRDDSLTPLHDSEDVPGIIKDPTQKWEVGKHYRGIRCVLLSEMWTVSPGYTALSEGYAYRVREVTPFRVSDPNSELLYPGGQLKDLNIAGLEPIEKSSFCMVNMNPWRLPDGRFFMPTRGFNNQFVYETSTSPRQSDTRPFKSLKRPNTAGDASSYPNYPFFSRRFFVGQPPSDPTKPGSPPVKALSKTFKFQGGEFEFEFYPLLIAPGDRTAVKAFDASANVGAPIQRVRVKFPPATIDLPVPEANEEVPKEPRFQNRINNTYLGLKDREAAPRGDEQNTGMGLVRPGDVIRSVEFSNRLMAHGDLRVLAGLADVPGEYGGIGETFQPSGLRTGPTPDYSNVNRLQVHNFRNSWGRTWRGIASDGSGVRLPVLGQKPGLLTPNSGFRPQGTSRDKLNKVPYENGDAVRPDGLIGDFDRGIGKNTDGPFINKPDEGNVRFKLPTEADGGHLPYFRGGNGYEETGQTYFSPNRLIPSPVMFGSLPNALFGGYGAANLPPRPWETLQFCPPISMQHTSALRGPADHHLLDFFHMPVVEPYAISEPLSTAGRINLNSRLAPFGYVKQDGRSYIQRHTGLYGVIKGMKQFLMRKDSNTQNDAGHREGPLNDRATKTRYDINPEIMMKEVIDPYFDSKKYFKYASQICDLDLPVDGAIVPPNINEITRKRLFNDTYEMTGDNSRERPYAHIYPRLTTKSNVFTVHVWAQSIAKNPATKKDDWKVFDETKDRILGEYRGSSTIERFVDADDETLRDYDAVEDTNAKSLDPYYRFRIVSQKRFTPQ